MTKQIIPRIKDDNLERIDASSWYRMRPRKTSYIDANSLTFGDYDIDENVRRLGSDELVRRIKAMRY